MTDISVTRRVRTRKQRDGSSKRQIRWIANFRDGEKRTQRFFASRQEAIDFRDSLIKGEAAISKPRGVTVGDLIDAWPTRQSKTVRPSTIIAYSAYVQKLVPLRNVCADKLTTRLIRDWHESSADCRYSMNRALRVLKQVLAVYAEDHGAIPIAIPTGLNRNTAKKPKQYLSIAQVKSVINGGGIYVAFPFLTGTRISEQLGLLWREIDFEAGVVKIVRTQDKRTGSLIEATKTKAGHRVVPISATLRAMLQDWRIRCPPSERVFPNIRGGPLLYCNFLHRRWKLALQRLGLPNVPIHLARASFISMLQAGGVDVATAAQIVGHKSPSVTLQFYTHSLNSAAQAVACLDQMMKGA